MEACHRETHNPGCKLLPRRSSNPKGEKTITIRIIIFWQPQHTLYLSLDGKAGLCGSEQARKREIDEGLS